MTHSMDLCMSETVNSFGNISNPCTVAFPAFKKNKTHSSVKLRKLDVVERNVLEKS